MNTQSLKYSACRDDRAEHPAKGQPAVSPPRCLLIVSGAPVCLKRILALLGRLEVEITWTISLEEAASACQCKYDLVIVDVEPLLVTKVLRTLRESAMLAECPVLVEHCRMEIAPELAGVLPRYRAMPCGFADLLQLANWYLFPATSVHHSYGGDARRLL